MGVAVQLFEQFRIRGISARSQQHVARIMMRDRAVFALSNESGNGSVRLL